MGDLNDHVAQLNGQPLAFFGKLFESLSSPPLDSLRGRYRARFVGPGWLRMGASRSLALGGLAGWWGKEFLGEGRATNLVRRAGAIERAAPMILRESPSRLDGRPGPVLTYPRDAKAALRYLRDELRFLETDTLLGLSFLPGLWPNRWPLPFLLVRDS